LVIDVDVALLLQQRLAVDLELDENATIFEICAAINEQGVNDEVIEAILLSLIQDLDPVVRAQISLLINQIIDALETILQVEIPDRFIDLILANIDYDSIVTQILANVEVSLDILQTCLGVDTTVQQMNPTIQQNNKVLSLGDSRLQLH
jgi:hypothetical protein